ncbi:MAG: hypothetical protein HeimC3_37180 [Candidatus Heimdallarchaeota archaeon LC_3]|nr:MAG: hypothetical protein HeimC3_37180 [Candidatus Heimdallarchaeota archaeon LC_3]
MICSIGNTWEYPAPAAPPLIPKTGPKEGCLNVTIDLYPNFDSPCVKPIEVVVFPSPAGVGLVAVTSIYFPFGCFIISIFLSSDNEIFAIFLPNRSISSEVRPIVAAIFSMCCIVAS